ncbi:MAG: protein translocase subunit SecD [Gammaproteobacteria bacterium]|nr:protein translocase subunit SecD [Gammaproteobacteria bacterium]MCP4088947.1 protein translocase subunit SecD [Gammaproteobacteria bacterium]MCP4274964.1 protein translocase subunit SecD [Gammaproteobacteria bacterium]MCP4831969.1 protein translocase subunit SecD [Gammaproteobacteria bacterium]MCP4929404.1 protein translocase subunit SecD [Gammaproteobacteria bacterium]
MNHYPAWKNLLVAFVLVIGVFIALPNLFGKAPSVQISRDDSGKLTEAATLKIEGALDKAGIVAENTFVEKGRLMLQFNDVEQQLLASELLRDNLGANYVVALTLAPRTPDWIRAIGLQPMSLGLDLRGGVHFLFEVDMDAAISQRMEIISNDINRLLRAKRIRRAVRVSGNEVRVRLGDASNLDQAEELISDYDSLLDIRRVTVGEEEQIIVRMTDDQIRARQDFAIQQNTVTLRNRVNALGVAEPLVQRQGINRIVVQLPGVQDPAQAERILDATATLEFRLVCEGENAYEAQRRGRSLNVGCELFYDRQQQPVLLKRGAIVTGDQLIDASQGFTDGSPAVNVSLDGKGADEMLRTTRENVGKPMAVLFVEQSRELVERDGETVQVTQTEREVINVATINGVFSSRFQITGVDVVEARDLSMLLRAGALAAPIYKVEERTIGPSLGQDNIDRGLSAILLGFALVVVFMGLYYRVFGIAADIALFTNLVLMVAILSMLQASLTLPGIAGIVLTVGMAVDANVLIFERIREELRNGNSPQASIHSGYEKALSTIADANVTTLIAAIVLFAFGTGPVKGFAITLSVGIVTSMFTSIIGTRALVNLIYGGRRLERLPI